MLTLMLLFVKATIELGKEVSGASTSRSFPTEGFWTGAKVEGAPEG
jgi:hypothetical protein